MKIIKGVLEEELEKAMLAENEYEKTLAGLPRGSKIPCSMLQGASITNRAV